MPLACIKMATNRTNSSFEAIVECSICLERLFLPKSLDCQHSFCKQCLAQILRRNLICIFDDDTHRYKYRVENLEIKCPNCNKIHHGLQSLSALTTPLYVVMLLDELEKLKSEDEAKISRGQCCLCDEDAKCWCVECSRDYCGHCLVDCMSQDHFIAKIKEGAGKGKSRQSSVCLKHGISLDYYCELCAIPMCIDCLLIEHKNHEKTTLDAICTKYRTAFKLIENVEKSKAPNEHADQKKNYLPHITFVMFFYGLVSTYYSLKQIPPPDCRCPPPEKMDPDCRFPFTETIYFITMTAIVFMAAMVFALYYLLRYLK